MSLSKHASMLSNGLLELAYVFNFFLGSVLYKLKQFWHCYPYTLVYESLYIYNKQITGNNELDALTMMYVM